MVLLCWSILCPVFCKRNQFRKQDSWVPQIVLTADFDKTEYVLEETFLGPYSYQCFDPAYLYQHKLPRGRISYRNNPKKSVSGTILKTKIKQAIKALGCGKAVPSDFETLKDRDFNYSLCCGLIVLKFRNYPFVVKLFMERPETLVKPFSRGFEVIFVFYMGAGMNRHNGGLLRIKNLDIVSKKLSNDPRFTDIDFPRKWFWMPSKNNLIYINGYHLGSGKIQSRMPATYAIVCDFIEPERQYSIFHRQDRKRALEICNYLEQWIDPHIDNFVIEKNTGLTVIIDTEHFPSMVGFNQPYLFQSYSQWYTHLVGKCFQEMYLRTKYQRLLWQKQRCPLVELSCQDYDALSLLHLP